MSVIKLLHGDCVELIKSLPDNSIDCILTDPPYLYLKHKLDRPFDEVALFAEWDRVLKPQGFILMFGRGESFYRWNYMLNCMGWKFKEEIIWDKSFISSPVSRLSRVHETISILSKKGSIRKVRVPYVEARGDDIGRAVADIQRLKGALCKPEILDAVNDFIVNGADAFTHVMPFSITRGAKIKDKVKEVTVIKSICDGFIEKSIMTVINNRYTAIHPTEKPVRLIERLLAITTDEADTVLDCFAGSGSTAVACHNANRNFIGYEIDDEYYAAASKRIAQLPASLF